MEQTKFVIIVSIDGQDYELDFPAIENKTIRESRVLLYPALRTRLRSRIMPGANEIQMQGFEPAFSDNFRAVLTAEQLQFEWNHVLRTLYTKEYLEAWIKSLKVQIIHLERVLKAFE